MEEMVLGYGLEGWNGFGKVEERVEPQSKGSEAGP